MTSRLIAAETKLGTFEPPSTILKSSDLTSGAGVTTKLEAVLSEFLGIVTIVASIALIFYFIIGTLNWITSNGDSGKIQKAREAMIQSVSGMVLVVAAYGLIGLIGNFLGLHILNPGTALLNIVNGTP